MTQRSAFVLRVEPDRIDEYVEAHRAVWPDMLQALRDAGIRNYSIFRDGTQVFGYFEADDLERGARLTWRRRRSARGGRTRWPTCSRSACPTPARPRSRRSSGSTDGVGLESRPCRSVQLFATCLGDLAFPRGGRRRRGAAARRRGTRSSSRRGRCAAASRHSTRATVRRRGGWRGRSCGRSRVRLPSSPPRARARRWRRTTCPSCSGSSRSRCGSCPRSSARSAFRPLPRNAGRRIAYHDSCHMLRELRDLGGAAAAARRARARSWCRFARPDLCCGFGGTFSVRQPEVSVAMADDKLAGGAAAGTIVTADPGLPDAPARAGREGRLAGSGRPSRDRARQGRRCLSSPSRAGRFRVIARGKLGDAHTQQALDDSTNRLRTHRLSAWEGLAGRRGRCASGRTRSGWR